MTPVFDSKQNKFLTAGALLSFFCFFLFSIPAATAITWNIDHTTVISNSTEFWITSLGSLGDVNISQFRADEPGKILSINSSWLDSLYVNVDGDTMTGSLGMSFTNITNVNSIYTNHIRDVVHIHFNTSFEPDDESPGSLTHNTEDDTLEYWTKSGQVIQLGREVSGLGKNDEGIFLPDGSVVALSGYSGDKRLFIAADGTNISKSALVGVLTTDCEFNEICPVTVFGDVRDIDTSSWNSGDMLWINPDEPGNLTNIKPSLPNNPIVVAYAGVIHENTGTVFAFPNFNPADGFLSNNGWFSGSVTIEENLDVAGNVTANEYSFDGIKLRNLSTNQYINGTVMGIMMTNPPNEELPHLYIQSGGDGQFSGMVRTWGVINEEVGFLNTTNRTDCEAYFNAIGEELKIDCKTTTTGADFFVSDDFQVVDEMWAKDTDGEWHFMTRELELLDELRDNTLLSRINTSLANGDNFTIANIEGEILIVNIDENNTFLNRTQESIILTTGTNETPIFNHIYYEDAANPVLTKATTEQTGKADVAELLMGADFDYGSIGGSANQDEFTRNVYRRFFDDGAIYKSGFDISADADDINISTGVMKITLNDFLIGNNHSTQNLAIEIHSNGTFHQHENDIEGFDAYSNGVPVGTNKYFNLVCGIAATQDFDGRLYCITQDEPSAEHTTVSGAENDNTYVQYFPNNEFLKKVYIPVVRVVIQNTPGGAIIQVLSNGEYYLDVRGRVTGAGSPPTPGITSHPDLENLNFSTAGHTGFFATSGESSMEGNADWDGYNLTNVSYLLVNDSVGIGLVNPEAPIHTRGSSGAVAGAAYEATAGLILENDHHAVMEIISNNARTGQIFFSDENLGRGRINYDHGDDSLSLWSASAERMTVDSSGNVGIGTTSPDAKLHVEDSTLTAKPNMVIDNAYNSSAQQIRLGLYRSGDGETVDVNSGLQLFATSTLTGLVDSENRRMGFWTGAGGTPTENIVLLANGRVGIGTTNPTYKLDVQYSANAGADAIRSKATNLNGSGEFRAENGDGGYGSLFKTGSTYVGYKTILANDLGFYNNGISGDISILNDYASGDILFAAGGSSTAHMVVESTGDVGINEVNPAAKLEINTGLATTIGQIIKASASQSASIFEARDSSDNMMVSFVDTGFGSTSSYALKFRSGSLMLDQGTSSPPRFLFLVNGDSFQVLNEAGSEFLFRVIGNTAASTTTLDGGNGGPDSQQIILHSTVNSLILKGQTAALGVQVDTIDSAKLFFGAAKDVSISYDGSKTQFINEVGSGNFVFPTGNVGVGTTSPDYKLQVNGTIAPEVNATYDLGTADLAWNNVYAVTYNDLTPAWTQEDGSALEAINRITNIGEELNHTSYPEKLRSKHFTLETQEQRIRQVEDGSEIINTTTQVCENQTVMVEEITQERNCIWQQVGRDWENVCVMVDIINQVPSQSCVDNFNDVCTYEKINNSGRFNKTCESINTPICEYIIREVCTDVITSRNITNYANETYDVRTSREVIVNESLTTRQQQDFVKVELNLTDEEITKTEVRYTRDIGGTLTMVVSAVRELFGINNAQDAKIEMLENELCLKDNTYSWC